MGESEPPPPGKPRKEVEAGDRTSRPDVSGFISRGLCGLKLESIMFPSIIDISLLRFTVRTLTDNCNTGDTELVILKPGGHCELGRKTESYYYTITTTTIT